jgi:hypothetical protein
MTESQKQSYWTVFGSGIRESARRMIIVLVLNSGVEKHKIRIWRCYKPMKLP